uniref:Uncharacterized protein n=1 Tax=Physcomitrium patens TaxID=3218 RepID=A0A2K1IRY5_PHYPA|nr:hypothetical protein PHYPA_026153 [Physcomitrium patens]
MENVSKMLTHSVAIVKLTVHKHTIDHEDLQDVSMADSKQESNGAVEHKNEGMGLMENMREVTHNVNEEVMEAMQEVKL